MICYEWNAVSLFEKHQSEVVSEKKTLLFMLLFLSWGRNFCTSLRIDTRKMSRIWRCHTSSIVRNLRRTDITAIPQLPSVHGVSKLAAGRDHVAICFWHFDLSVPVFLMEGSTEAAKSRCKNLFLKNHLGYSQVFFFSQRYLRIERTLQNHECSHSSLDIVNFVDG